MALMASLEHTKPLVFSSSFQIESNPKWLEIVGKYELEVPIMEN